MRGLKYVVVVIGPNDLAWGDFLTYCYAVADCHDNLTQGSSTTGWPRSTGTTASCCRHSTTCRTGRRSSS
ncbi:hypothetical protein [Dactylosporangium cerinum]